MLSFTCQTCPSGYYCPPKSSTLKICPMGFYCPVGSSDVLKPCPRGTFGDLMGLVNFSDCKPCSPGYYCDKQNATSVTGLCASGYYCRSGSDSKEPVGDHRGDAGPCPPGYYCPLGTANPIGCPIGTFSNLPQLRPLDECQLCSQGYYCDRMALTIPSGPCQAGFYCVMGSNTSRPTQVTQTGGPCPPGYYCTEGSSRPQPCPAGTYNPFWEQKQCLFCPQGHYCEAEDINSALCPSELNSVKTHRYPSSRATPKPCPSGEYQDQIGQIQCKPCPLGKHCDPLHVTGQHNESKAGTIQPIDCPAGYYCIKGMLYPCPEGTYSNQTGRYSIEQCKPCPGGKYCALKGMSGYTGLCDPGCVCVLGASYPCPADNITGYKCPPGSYCPQGASHGIKCPAGTFGPQDSLYSIFECITCTPGFYCDTEGLETPTGPCSPGYFCLYGATLPNPVGDLYGDKCPPGHFCPSGSISPRPCPLGTYQPLHGMTSKNACLPCTGGKYCEVQGLRHVSGDCTAGFYCISGASRPSPIDGITGGRCPPGHYCPTASSQPLKCKSAGQYCDRKGLSTPSGICPPGFYCPGAVCKSQPEIQTNTSDHHGIQNFMGNICPPGFYCPEGSSQPVPCDLGQYCGQPGLSSPTGPCVAGFLCDGKASVMNPKPCPAGYYCPEGTTYSKPCPPGTLSGPGGVAVTDCSPCPSGHYCETYSLSAPSGLCSAGYYCPRGQSVPEPLDYICSPGHFCPEGSSNQTSCAPGHYQPKWAKERCEICPPGYYCQTSGVFKPVLCPLGSFCPPKSTSQHFCPEGTYGNRTGLHEASGCLPCDPGMYCQGSGNTKPTGPCSAGYMCILGAALPTPTDGISGDKCLPGFFCTNGSVTGQPCPKGTFSDKRGLSAARHCQNCSPGHFCAETGLIAVSGPCWAGFYCLEGSKTPTPIASVFGDICSPGHFCPNATTHPVPCPPGTLRATTGGRSEEDCMSCPSGFYCKKPGKDSVEGFCDPGFYCLNGAKTATPRDGATGDLCPVGYYCPLASPGLKLCQNGTSMNHTGAEKCNICPEGSLCTKRERTEPCPEDSYCPKDSGTFPQPCPVGTFGASRGLRKKSDCIPCLGGSYCSRPGLSEVEGPCDPGFYCESGVNSPRPSQYLDHTGNGGECSVGAYCPRNSTVPIPCPPGTYNSEIGQSDCKICLAGYFCLGGTSNPFPLKCPTGHFCPERTQFGEEYHCRPGTYNSLPGQQSPADCLICPPGQFCEGTGLSTPSGNCSKGWYCTGGSVTSKPLPQGEFSNISEWASQKNVSPGNRCPPGFFCPEGSSLPLICTAGFYCDQYELAEPTGPCDAGYYCPIGSTERAPDTSRCVAGHYCPEGSPSPKPCPEGTYSNTPMNKVPENCLPCTPGFFCEGIGLFHPTGLCVSGYYCPGGQSAPTPANLSCPPGSRCPAGSPSPDPCPGGFYQALQGQFECNPCPAGSYCYTSELDKWGVEAPQRCPPGHFCPPRTEFGTQYKCPPGTFSNKEGQISAAECDLCPPGQFCGQEGLIKPSGFCLTGFYCFRGAMYPNPTDGITGDICPMGKFCEAGSVAGVDCPIGHYSNKTGLTSPSDCTPCDPGFHCSRPGLTAPQGPCARGYYCRLGAQSPNPDNGIEGAICPAGYYCVSGTERPVPCPVGTYNPSEGRDSVAGCLPCDPGHYCGNIGLIQPSGLCFEGYYCIGHTSQPTPQDGENGGVCPEGFYCQAGTHKPVPCPIGTFLNHSGGTKCVVCPAGFYCIYGKKINPCPLGFYCPEGTGADIAPCPAGTYGGRMGLKEENDCFQCKGGFYCARDGLSSPQGKCDPGHYCISGVNVPNPGPTQIFLGKGGKCGTGQQCPSGSVLPQTCPPGTYTEEEGLEHCKTCPAGYYCPPTSMIPKLCPPGYYCPTATEEGTQYPCPPGTYNGQSGSRSERECLVCPAGQYCSGSGLLEPSGLCAAGYYCTGGSTTNKPTPSHLTSNISLNSTSDLTRYEWCFKQHYVMGGLCPAGYYCPTGSSTPLPCDGGKYCSNPGLSIPTDECFAGYYCDAASTQPDQHICPAGFYCPNSTTIPVPCLPGTCSNSSGNEKESDCQPCLSGQFCDGPGNVVPDGPCSMGFYCPPGQSSARPMLLVCPINFYCPEGTSIPLPCRGGTYQANKGQGSCDPCPAGFFCQFTNGSSGKLYEPCPAGFFCPAGTTMGTEHPCATGTFGPRPGLAHESSCVPCSPGMHCASAGLSNPTGPCHPGYYCTGSAISPTPIKHLVEFDNATFTGNDVCPIGHYCPEGSQHPWPCPQGSYSHTVGLASEAQCQRCPHGHYCNQLALTDSSQAQPCDPGYICHTGSTVPRPSDGIQGYVCPRGHRCPAGVIRELACKAGTYNPSPGAGICLPCPAGTVCSNSSTVEPTACPKGYYCSSRTTFPLPCPEGTYNALNGAFSADVCLSCPAGLYCQGMANSEPDGPCTEGYYCQGGASSPIPQSNPKFPMNGPCAAGYYCPAGTKSPVACPKGTFKNTTGGASSEFCASCYPGYYCANEGLSQPSGLCFAGFYCPGNHNSVNPNAFSCPKGYFCSEGSGSPIPCPAGKYQPNMRSDVCIPCQAGFYCKEAATVNQITCPPHFYCPNGTQNPNPCPSGTFTSGQTTGLKDEKECLPCPTGKYCSRGRIQGFCAAGYFCLAGSHSPIPHGIFPNDTHERNLCEWGQLCAGQCPAGFYCPEGTETTKACPENTIRLQPGGRQLEECQPCPLGHWCKQGDPVLHRCPAGYFCDDVIRAPFSLPIGPQKCPVHTYSNITGATSQAACQPCPPGYYCNETGLTSYENYLCPLGYWCPGKGSHHFCPGGTIGNQTGASFYKHCQPCPPGYYCPDPRRTGQPNINGVPCQAGYECPEGSITEIPCRPASYCGPRTGNATVCPGGYFCPLGSSTYNTPKQLCVFPYFCPANSSSMLPCDGGYMPINVTGLRDRLEKACLICEAGTYRRGSANELHCSPCPEGFYCPVGSESYLLNPCPVGYYCSEMTRLPIPCSPGTYGNSSHAKHNSECYPCPENTFNHLDGQRACFPCGSTSYSSLGSITCKCQGFNRAFQESDGSCICKTGHVYYDETDQKSSNSNSDMDCYPEVYDRCSVGEVRLASTRRCVLPERHNCTPACGEYGGRLDVELGMCHCNKYISAEELCDGVCMAGILNVSAHASHTGELVLTVKNGATRDHKNWVVPHVLGPDGHITDSLRVLFILFKPNGIFGLILSGKYVVDKFLTESEWPDMFQNPHFKTKRSYLQRPVSAAMNGVIPKIPNPIVCLRPNDLILFKLSVHQSNRSLSHYPVYQKDHLFNTNSDWDFGPFRKLDHFIKETNFNFSRFAHVFMEPGKYVFYDNAEPERALIVSVNKFGECDNVPSLVQPSSPIHLVQRGILKQQDLNLAPDWALIIGTLCFLALITVLFTMSAMVMTPIQSVLNPMQKWKPKWRSLGEPYMPPEYIILKDSLGLYETLRPRIAGEGAEAEEESTLIVGKSLAETELEDFSVRTLYDKLEDQNLHLAAQLNKHKSDVQAFYRHISQQTQELKKILECFNSCKCQNKEGKWTLVEDLETMSRAQAEAPSTMTRDRFGNCTTINFWERSPVTQRNQSSQHLEELFNKLNVLVHKINSGHITISKEMIARAQRLYMFSDGVTVSAQTNTEQEETNPVEQFAVDSAEVSGNMEKLGTILPPVKEDLSVHDSFTDSIFPYDEGLTEILVSSSLLKKLEELKQALVKNHCALKTESCDVNPLDPIPWSNQNLIPADLGSLPPHHFVIYRFGCYIAHLLCSSCNHSPLTLLLADNIPTEVRAPCQNILYKNSFYYDANNRILYIKTTWLNNAGEFIVSILHTMAHIKAGTQINDSHHIFTEEFERAVAAVGTTLFLMCCDTTDNGTDDSKDTKILDSENRNKDKQLTYVQSIFEDLIHIKVPPETKFTEEILKERLKKYTFFTLHSMGQQILEPSGTSRKFPILEGKTAAAIHPEMDSEDKDEGVAEYNMQTRIAELEEEIDETNEAFSLYTTKIAEENQQLEHLEQELRIQANLAQEPGEECKSLLEDFRNLLKNLSQARDVLSMLDLQRRCVINRLTELESELAGFYTALEDRPTRIST
ncbi:zonadhesin isoform X4 [Chiloscyllium plagiosum]|uniref:zonadhesin isoform X4 n=1 Tax=Chiloscyllium plagiosum TaxID=36176 RepID=UPI001CB7FEA5|nr:zonadhesin isoform X4 [Chiloscyllium plagiosum]